MKSLKDVKPGDKIFVLNSNRGYLKEPQIEILTANKVGILYIYTDYDKYKKSNGEAVESSLLEKEIKINKIDTRIQLTAMAAILKPSEMSDTDFVLKINEKMSELWSEEALIRQGAKINQELLEIQKTLDEIEKQGDM